MAKVEMNEIYVNRKNPERRAVVCRVDDKAKTAILQPEDGGKAIGPMSFPTLGKSWKKVDQLEPSTSEANAVAADFEKDETQASDGTPYNKVIQEIIEDGKKAKAAIKKEKKISKKTPTNPDAALLYQFVTDTVTDMQAEIFTPANGMKMHTFKVGGHMFAKFNFSSKGVTLACRSKAVSVPADRTINHMFDSVYTFTSLNKDSKAVIKKLLRESLDYQKTKNSKKEEN